MAKVESDEDSRKRLEREHAEFQKAIIDAHDAFAWFEQCFALVLSAAINSPNFDLAMHIYFAPSATETRIDVVSAAVQAVILPHPEYARMNTCWMHITNVAGRLKSVRNRIMHGQITTVSLAHGAKQRVRLCPIVFDVARHMKDQRPRQFPGLSANDIFQSANAMRALNDENLKFGELLMALWRKDEPTLRQTLAELEALRQP